MYPIVLNADENYIKYASVLITNIIHNIDLSANFAKNPIHFHILTNTLSTKDNLLKLQDSLSAIYPCSITCHFIDESIFASLPTLNGNHSAYWRIVMAEYLPLEIDTCLYLDVDMLVLCDIREIFTLKCDSTLACVPDFGRYANRILKPITNAPAITFSKDYFNSGFLRIHLKQWRAQNIQEQCLKILENYHLKFHDQDILNAVFAQNYHKLSFCYDFIAQAFGASVCKDESKHHYNIHHTRDEFNRIRENIKILHFCGEKPWNTLASYIYEGQFITTLWWEFALKTPIFNQILLEQKAKLSSNTQAHALGFLILQTKGVLNILKLPLNILKHHAQNATTNTSTDTAQLLQNPLSNTAYELGKLALRLSQSSKKPKYFILLFRILRAKNRYKP